MTPDGFEGIETWVFDLDNTLYPAECHLFAQIDAKMTEFIQRRFDMEHGDARKIQKDLYAKFGTTLSGLMTEFDVPPHDFLDYVHDIDLTGITVNASLKAALQALPGRKIVFTNGSVKHAENVAGAIGILDLFDDIFDIEQSGFVPKPHSPAYDRFFDRFSIDAGSSAMFEDIADNLRIPHETGMRTVLVQSDADWCADEPLGKRPSIPGERFSHVDCVTSDLTSFLQTITPTSPA